MADLKAKYVGANTAITCDPSSLADGGARASTVVDNSTNLYIDAQVAGKIKSGGSALTTGTATIYAYGSADGGTTYTDTATGTDATVTLAVPTNAIPIGVINVVASTTTYKFGPFSVAKAFGGVLPQKWGIIVVNNAGAALDATAGSFSFFFTGIQFQSV